MTVSNGADEFAERLRAFADRFKREEASIREQYARQEGGHTPPDTVLERATRHYLIDNLLRALDWNPDTPSQVVQEARSHGDKEWLYFDYLGLKPQTRAPIMLVEAKGFDAPLPRGKRGSELGLREMAELLAKDVDNIKAGKSLSVVHAWVEFLNDLHAYIRSLDELGKATLKRVVITAGRWVIVFSDPIASFMTSGRSNTEHIHCFASIEEMLARREELYCLLHRRCLVDTLGTTISIADALEMAPPQHLQKVFRGVLVVTTPEVGALRHRYPIRSIYPALVIKTTLRWFAIVNFNRLIEEPKGADRIGNFLNELSEKGSSLEKELSSGYGMTFVPAALGEFPGFPATQSTVSALNPVVAPLPGSTVGQQISVAPVRKRFVMRSGEPGATSEYIAVTGTQWFYKADGPGGPPCGFHDWRGARDGGVGADAPMVAYGVDSFTEDGQDRHCAHKNLISIRAERCHIRNFEKHMCCKTCIFFDDCWSTGDVQLPCPPPNPRKTEPGNLKVQ